MTGNETEYAATRPFYEAICDEKGRVFLRVARQTFRLAYDPIEAEEFEGISGYGKAHGEWLRGQLQTALDKIRTGIQ